MLIGGRLPSRDTRSPLEKEKKIGLWLIQGVSWNCFTKAKEEKTISPPKPFFPWKNDRGKKAAKGHFISIP